MTRITQPGHRQSYPEATLDIWAGRSNPETVPHIAADEDPAELTAGARLPTLEAMLRCQNLARSSWSWNWSDWGCRSRTGSATRSTRWSDLLSAAAAAEPVLIGHQNAVLTLNLAQGADEMHGNNLGRGGRAGPHVLGHPPV